jgi:multiple sugar transport system substrate-binding protein
MRNVARREVLRALAAAAVAASGVLPGRGRAGADPGAPIERGAELRLLRWKRYVQGDEDLWMANTAKFTQRTGVKVQVESIVGEELRAKGAMVASVGAGPDIVVGSPEMPHQYADKCVDLTEVATYLGEKYGGWYEVCERSCIRDGRWIAMSVAVVSFCVVYRQSMVKAAGFDGIPRDLDGFLALCRALKARGTPAGLPLGSGLGDHSWCQWLLWSYGASLVDENDRVVIDSKETVAALEYAKALYPTFVPGTLAWLDPSNNKAFLAGEISLTWNPISIYYVARTSSDPALKAMAADIQHAHLPIGPLGRPMELHGLLTGFVFKHSKYPNAAREYLRFMLEREQYEAWQQASLGYMCQTLRAYESNPIWTSDPKITPFRDGPRLTQYSAYPGKVGPASAAVAADLIIPQMFAEAASGSSTVKAAIARAEQRAKRHYK